MTSWYSLEPLPGKARAIRDDHRCSGPEERGPSLEMGRRSLDQTLLGHQLDRGKLAAHLIDRPGLRNFFRELRQHVEVRHAGLDHEDVSALSRVAQGRGKGVA